MNTTPLISETLAYTVVGGPPGERERREVPGLSIVLLNRGGKPFRKDLFEELKRLDVREIISVETPPCPYDLEVLSRRHHHLRFVLFSRQVDPGVCINIGIREAVCNYVYVLWNDMKLSAESISSRVFAKIAERERLCVTPRFVDLQGQSLPTVMLPLYSRSRPFDVQPVACQPEESPTLCPWDYAGIYKREKHLLLGGFDEEIQEPYWQKLDYGMRGWLWGEEIYTIPALEMGYLEEVPLEDSSSGPGYWRFSLKNLAVRFRGDAGSLPLSRLLQYRRATGDKGGSIRLWIQKNKFRFVRDAVSLVQLWGGEGGE